MARGGGYQPVIYVGEAPASPRPFLWGVLVGAAGVALAFLAVLLWPVP
jgi:uncharacterized protein involved in exopolysaccharide biosynthesis